MKGKKRQRRELKQPKTSSKGRGTIEDMREDGEKAEEDQDGRKEGATDRDRQNRPTQHTSYREPTWGGTRQVLCRIWQQLLGQDLCELVC